MSIVHITVQLRFYNLKCVFKFQIIEFNEDKIKKREAHEKMRDAIRNPQ